MATKTGKGEGPKKTSKIALARGDDQAEETAIAKREDPEILPPAVADDIIDGVYGEIQHLYREATVNLWTKIGEIIVHHFYGGELAAWRERGEKDTSFRKLAAKFEDSEISASRLSRMVGVYELGQRLGVAAIHQLSTTHLIAVLGLPEPEQKRLIEQATAKDWTTRELREKAQAARKKEGDKRGRPVLPAFVKGINQLKRMLDDDEGSFGDLDEVEGLSEEKATELYQAVTGMKLRCEALQKALEGKTTGFKS